MKLALTDGMDGTAVISVLKESDNPDEILKFIDIWKLDSENMRKYKIESYNRMIFAKDEKIIFIDFGDYMTFFAIICGTLDEYSMMSKAITGMKD